MTENFVIIPDSSCDLSREIREKYDIEFVPCHFTTPDGSEHSVNLEWDFSGRKEFYSALKKNPSGYKTSPANASEFEKVFEKYVKEGRAILCPVISSKMSGTFGFASKGKENLLKKYPNARIEVIDSLRFSAATGLMAIHAAEMRKEGKTFDEVVSIIKESRLCYHQAGFLDDLSFTARQGRINNSAAFFGTLIGIKPIGDIDTNGLTTVIGKAKGEKKAFSAILSYIKKTITNAENQTVIISYSDREESAKKLKEMVEAEIKPKDILVTTVFPSCGVSIGPGLMAIYYKGTPVSEGLVNEKKIIGEFLS